MIYEKDLSDIIIGLAIEVHKILGAGFLEAVYEEALGIEFEQNNIKFEKQKELEIKYKTSILQKKYYADFLIDNKIILELKATDNICSEHISQLLNYLKATKMKVGYILNFGTNKLEFKRIVL